MGGGLYLSIYVITPKLILLWVYGWSRVHQEHLRLLATPGHAPWPVSNGDLIAQGNQLLFAIGVPCWFALVFGLYPLLRLLLPRRRERDRD